MTAAASSTEPVWFPPDCGVHESRKPLARCWRCERAAKELEHELNARRVGNQLKGYRLVHDEKAREQATTRVRPASTEEDTMPQGQRRSAQEIAAVVADVTEHGLSKEDAAKKHGVPLGTLYHYLRDAGHGSNRKKATARIAQAAGDIVSTIAQPEVRQIELGVEQVAQLLGKHIPAGSTIEVVAYPEDDDSYGTSGIEVRTLVVRFTKPVAA